MGCADYRSDEATATTANWSFSTGTTEQVSHPGTAACAPGTGRIISWRPQGRPGMAVSALPARRQNTSCPDNPPPVSDHDAHRYEVPLSITATRRRALHVRGPDLPHGQPLPPVRQSAWGVSCPPARSALRDSRSAAQVHGIRARRQQEEEHWTRRLQTWTSLTNSSQAPSGRALRLTLTTSAPSPRELLIRDTARTSAP